MGRAFGIPPAHPLATVLSARWRPVTEKTQVRHRAVLKTAPKPIFMASKPEGAKIMLPEILNIEEFRDEADERSVRVHLDDPIGDLECRLRHLHSIDLFAFHIGLEPTLLAAMREWAENNRNRMSRDVWQILFAGH
jgi:hypothetical protein